LICRFSVSDGFLGKEFEFAFAGWALFLGQPVRTALLATPVILKAIPIVTSSLTKGKLPCRPKSIF
jgi:hypothetical protein